MIIVKIENLKRNRIRVIFDEESYVLNQKLMIDYYLYPGKEMGYEEVASLVHKGQYFDAYDKAVNYIAYQPRTRFEVRNRMKKEEYDKSVINSVLDALIEEKYIDDKQYALDYYESYRRKYGIFRIVSNLKGKGIDESEIESVQMEDDEDVAYGLLLKKYGKALESKIHIIHCGIDVEKFRPRAAKKGTVPIILAVGELTERKGFTYLVEACSIMKKNGYSFKCLFVGEGEDREVLNRKSSSVRVDDIVVFLGRQLQEKVLKLLEATTIFCLPSIITDKGGREGIPVALMEAMAMELPVVSTRTAGIPELIGHQREGLLVPQKDPVSLASALEKLLDNKELRIAMGSAARKKL